MTNIFADFKDISVREEILTKLGDLERILNIEEELIKKYRINDLFDPFHLNLKKGQVILAEDAEEKMQGIFVTAELLCQYVLARSNPQKNKEAWIRGLYSGFLLNKVCERNEETEKITNDLIKEPKDEKIILVDGKNNCFNYFFAFAKHVKNLFLKNIKGIEILSYAGSYEGFAEKIRIKNLEGSGLLFSAGSDNGSMEKIIIQNVIGNGTLYSGGRSGKICQVVLSEIDGHNTLFEAGRSGTAEHITVSTILGSNTLRGLASEGGIAKHITMQNIRGELMLYAAASSHPDFEWFDKDKKEGNIEYCVSRDSSVNSIRKPIEGIKKFYFGDMGEFDSSAKGRKYTESDNFFLLKDNMVNEKRDILKKIFFIADFLPECSFEKQIEMQRDIASLQKELFL